MAEDQDRIRDLSITEEMRSSYIDYSMSVIVGRALPDVRDGLKPVHRRVLFGMSELGLGPGSTYKKSARIVGEVLGKYHPHGEGAVYDTMVRMAQEFSLRYPLVDGQGNFGSVDGDSAAAMRYTEARMTRLAAELLRDIKEETADFHENFDGSLEEPSVLPAAVPNLLVNGSDGIAVGMATKIPPHNLREVVQAVVACIENPDISLLELMEHVPGPDFPTGGIIYGHEGVQRAYLFGRGSIVMRARIHEEHLKSGRSALVITEIPYQVNKSRLVSSIADQARLGRIDDVYDLRDESDREGMRIVVELKRDASPQVVEAQLYKHTKCQDTFGANLVALADGRPVTLTLKDAIRFYIAHRLDVVVRRTRFQLSEARTKAHILEGLTKALDHLDAVISMIRESDSTDAARMCLMTGVLPDKLTMEQRTQLGLADAPLGTDGVWMTEAQADAILGLRLRRLTGLEREKIQEENQAIGREVERLSAILDSEPKRMEIIKNELLDLAAKYGDDRRTEIDYAGGQDIRIEELIPNTRVCVTLSHEGLVKRTEADEFRRQGRGGIGVRVSGLRADDSLEHLVIADNHDYLLFFTDYGQCYWMRGYDIPQGTRISRGRSIRNFIAIDKDDHVRAILTVAKEDFRDEGFLKRHYVLMATRLGLVKKTQLWHYRRPRKNGIKAILIREGDELLDAQLTSGNAEVVLASSMQRAVRFRESAVRSMGRASAGVRGIVANAKQPVIGMVVVEPESEYSMLGVSEHGYGKRTTVGLYRLSNRGGKGVYAHRATRRAGRLVAVRGVHESDDVMILTKHGTLVRFHAADVPFKGRWTQGVRLIRLRDGDAIADVRRVPPVAGEPSPDASE